MVENKRILKIILYMFYTVVALSLVLIGYYLWDEKETFYLSQDSIVMLKNREYTIDLYGRTGSKTNDQYVYTSENENVVTVDENGVVHAVNGGETKVKVKSKYSDKENIMDVEVHDNNLYAIAFENDNVEMDVYEKYKPKLLINGTDEYNLNVNYTVSDPTIISVDNTGTIEALKDGIAYVEAKIGGTNISTKIKITVIKNEIIPNIVTIDPDPVDEMGDEGEDADEEIINTYVGVSSVEVSKLTYDLNVGEKEKVNYIISPKDATNKNVIWSIGDSNIAIVDDKGSIVAKKTGRTNIILETEDGNKTAILTINVKKSTKPIKIEVNSISLDKTNLSIIKGKNEKLNVEFYPENATNKKVTWSSSNSNVVSVDSNGNITAKKVGVATITVTSVDGNKKAICDVSVTENKIDVTNLTLDKTKVTLEKGSSTKLNAKITPKDATDVSLTWTSSNNNIVSVNNGNITAKNIGTAIITVTSNNGKKATSEVTVTDVKISKIALSKSDTQVLRGENFKVDVTITPSTVIDKSVTWTSSNTKVATVDNNGNVKALDYGSSTIKATTKDGTNKSAKFIITVVPYKKLITLTGKNYTPYYRDIGTVELINEYGPYYRHIQNFSISNIGTSNEIIYLSTAQIGSYDKNKTLTFGQLNNLNRTIVYKVTKDKINKPEIENRPRMYLEQTGHGQSFDIEPNSDILWINTYARTPEVRGNYRWGGSTGIMRIKWTVLSRFKWPANGKANYPYNFNPIASYKITDSNGKAYSDPAVAVDEENNLIAVVANKTKAFVYNYKDLQNGKMTKVYDFTLNGGCGNTYSNGTSMHRQGIAFKDGYIYQLRGTTGNAAYVEAFDLTGKAAYCVKVGGTYTTANNREPEGIHIYNDIIYIGSIHDKKIPLSLKMKCSVTLIL